MSHIDVLESQVEYSILYEPFLSPWIYEAQSLFHLWHFKVYKTSSFESCINYQFLEGWLIHTVERVGDCSPCLSEYSVVLERSVSMQKDTSGIYLVFLNELIWEAWRGLWKARIIYLTCNYKTLVSLPKGNNASREPDLRISARRKGIIN